MTWVGGRGVLRMQMPSIYTAQSPPQGAARRRLMGLIKKRQRRKSWRGGKEKIRASACDGEKLNQTTLVRVRLSVRRINQFIEKDYVPDGALIYSDLANLICLCSPDG